MLFLICPDSAGTPKVCTWVCSTLCRVKPCYGVDPI